MTIILLILGLIAGLIAGIFGVGGGIIFTPVLFFLFEQAGMSNSVPWAVASGLMCTWITALASVVRQYNQQHLFLKEGLLLGFFGALGISLGKWVLLSPYYSRTEFIIVFSRFVNGFANGVINICKYIYNRLLSHLNMLRSLS